MTCDAKKNVWNIVEPLWQQATWLTRPVGWCCALCCEGRFCQLLRWFMFFSTKKMALMLFWCCLVCFLFNVAVGHLVLHVTLMPHGTSQLRQVNTSPQPCGIRFLSNARGAMSSSLRAVQLGSYCRSKSLPGGSQRVHWQNAWTLPRFEKHLTLAKTLEDSMRMLGLADLATTGVLCSCHEIHNAYHRYHSWAVRVQKNTKQ